MVLEIQINIYSWTLSSHVILWALCLVHMWQAMEAQEEEKNSSFPESLLLTLHLNHVLVV